jgi:hypothetical protein
MKCQSFNTVEVRDGIFTKKSCNDYGDNIIFYEINFYKNICSNLFPNVLKLGENFLQIEHLETYKPLKEFSGDINIVMSSVNTLHCTREPIQLSESDYKKQLQLETIDKVQTRNSKIVSSLPACTHVNGVQLMTLDEVTSCLRDFIHNYKGDYRFHVIHGDLNFGNILYDPKKGIKFIDPRGYFGTYKLFGPKEYDFAKMYFSMSGYDTLYDSPVPLLYIENCHGYISLPPIPDGLDDLTSVLCVSIWLAASLYFDKSEKLASCYYYSLYLATLRFKHQSMHAVSEGN